MPQYTIAVLGGVVQDLTTIVNRLPDNGETVVASTITMQAGGKGSNSAVACYRLTRSNPISNPENRGGALRTPDNDVRVRMVSAVGGADDFGPPLKENLIKCGVNVDGVRTIEGQRTAVANILVEKDSGANRMMHYPGAGYNLEPAEFMTRESLGGGVAPNLLIAQLEVGRDTVEQAIETAYREGVEVLLSPSPAVYLMPRIYAKVSHLVMNETEAVMLSLIKPDDIENQTGWTKVAKHFLKLGVKNVVITLGDKGAYYSNEKESGSVEAEKDCSVLDTSGAGQVFPLPSTENGH